MVKTIIDIPYNFNVDEEHWRLKQHTRIIGKADSLANISPQVIIDVQNILDKSNGYIYHETLDVKNIYLVNP